MIWALVGVGISLLLTAAHVVSIGAFYFKRVGPNAPILISLRFRTLFGLSLLVIYTVVYAHQSLTLVACALIVLGGLAGYRLGSRAKHCQLKRRKAPQRFIPHRPMSELALVRTRVALELLTRRIRFLRLTMGIFHIAGILMPLIAVSVGILSVADLGWSTLLVLAAFGITAGSDLPWLHVLQATPLIICWDRRSILLIRLAIAGYPTTYSLYLRSFELDGNLFESGWLNTVNHPLYRSSEMGLSFALDSIVPIISLSATNAQSIGPPGAAAHNEEWREVIAELVQRSKLILFVLKESGGLAWELELLAKRQWFDKCIFVMPPLNPKVFDETEWDRIATKCIGLGLSVPVYDRRGRFFTVHSDGRLRRVRPLIDFNRIIIRRELRRLMPELFGLKA